MSANAYPISAPTVFTGTGAIYFANTGAIDFNNQTVTDFVTSAIGSTLYVGAGGALADLPIGAPGQYLKVNPGATAPEWTTLASEGPIFSAFSTGVGLTGAITADAAWKTLDENHAAWDMTAPGVTGGAFNPATGVFTATDAGVYEFACSVAFQGNNSAGQVVLTPGPGGLASRQLALQLDDNVLPLAQIVYATRQAEPSNSNDTQVAIYNAKLSLASGDKVSIAVRHDATTPLEIRGDSRTSFSGSRVR
jgi:hypothetical protein